MHPLCLSYNIVVHYYLMQISIQYLVVDQFICNLYAILKTICFGVKTILFKFL